MSSYQTEQERRKGNILNEIMELTQREDQTPNEIIDALVTALAKNVVRFNLSDKHIRHVEGHLAQAIEFQRELAAPEPAI